jgi:VIT1/CCC1 family predicted Fe2+/Mn2+ transporter
MLRDDDPLNHTKLHETQTEIGEERMSLTSAAGRNLGMLLLGLWLILTGLLPLLSIKISPTVTTALAVLGIVAGILILLRR